MLVMTYSLSHISYDMLVGSVSTRPARSPCAATVLRYTNRRSNECALACTAMAHVAMARYGGGRSGSTAPSKARLKVQTPWRLVDRGTREPGPPATPAQRPCDMAPCEVASCDIAQYDIGPVAHETSCIFPGLRFQSCDLQPPWGCLAL